MGLEINNKIDVNNTVDKPDNEPKTEENTKKESSIFFLEDDAKGEVGHGTFEMSDIKGTLEFYTSCILRSKLSQYIGKEFSKVKDSVQNVLNSLLTSAGELKNTVDNNKLKDENGNVNKKELVSALRTIEENTIAKGQSYEVFLTAIDELLNDTFGLKKDSSWDGARQHFYSLENGVKIAYTHGQHVTIKINGECFSYNMQGEEIDNPKDNMYVLNSENNTEKYDEKNKDKILKQQTQLKENYSRCPILPQNVQSNTSMQGLKKDGITEMPEYKFTDSTGRELVAFGDIYHDSQLKFDKQGRLIYLGANPNAKALSNYTYEYDKKGNLISIIDRNGWGDEKWSTNKKYDSKNRIISETYGHPTRDEKGSYITKTYSYKGDEVVETEYESDKYGNPI